MIAHSGGGRKKFYERLIPSTVLFSKRLNPTAVLFFKRLNPTTVLFSKRLISTTVSFSKHLIPNARVELCEAVNLKRRVEFSEFSKLRTPRIRFEILKLNFNNRNSFFNSLTPNLIPNNRSEFFKHFQPLLQITQPQTFGSNKFLSSARVLSSSKTLTRRAYSVSASARSVRDHQA